MTFLQPLQATLQLIGTQTVDIKTNTSQGANALKYHHQLCNWPLSCAIDIAATTTTITDTVNFMRYSKSNQMEARYRFN